MRPRFLTQAKLESEIAYGRVELARLHAESEAAHERAMAATMAIINGDVYTLPPVVPTVYTPARAEAPTPEAPTPVPPVKTAGPSGGIYTFFAVLLIVAVIHLVAGGGDGLSATSTCGDWRSATVEQRTAYAGLTYTEQDPSPHQYIDLTCSIAHEAGHDNETIPDPTTR